jgi:RNA polymerase sigma-70 factor (ECF subfamily)
VADETGLFVEHHRRLFQYFCRAVGHAETARDLTQDVFLRVSRVSDRPSGSGPVRAWLFHIARNLALDYHRARLRRPEVAPLVDQGTHPASQDVGVAVNQALSSLDALDRDVFLMREVAGLGYEEIARACELTPDAVRSRIHRTRLLLRERLAAPIATQRTVAMRRSGRII